MTNEVDYGLIIEFEDKSESYANGYRAGLVDARMKNNESEIHMMIEADNHSVYKQLCGHYGYVWDIKQSVVNEWNHATFTKSKSKLEIVK